MARKSKREIERALDDLDPSPPGGIETVTIRKYASDPETGEPVECFAATEHDVETGESRELDTSDIEPPADWEANQ